MQNDPQDSIFASLAALRKSFFLLLGASVLVAILAYGVTKNIPGTYEVYFSYMISMDQKDAASGFRYDGYYALSAADLFSTTLARIIDSPETIVAAYKEANVPLPAQDAIRLVRAIRSEKVAPQLVRVVVKDASLEQAEQLASGIVSVTNAAINDYNAKGLSSIAFQGVPTPSWTSLNTPAPFPVALSFFMVMFFGSNLIVLFREAFKRGAS